MAEKREILDRILNQPTPVQVWAAEVTAVSGSTSTCTVKLIESDLEIDEVLLCAEQEVGDKWMLTPKLGSRVLVGLIENELSQLYVAHVSEVDEVTYKKGNLSFILKEAYLEVVNSKTRAVFEDGRVLIKYDQTTIEVAQKFEIATSGVSLKDLFVDLITLLNSFSVLTSTGPSAGLNPATITLLTQLQTKVNLLLK